MGPPFSVKFTSEKETDELWILFLLYANNVLANAFSVDLILTPPWPRSSSQHHHHLPSLHIKLCHTGTASGSWRNLLVFGLHASEVLREELLKNALFA